MAYDTLSTLRDDRHRSLKPKHTATQWLLPISVSHSWILSVQQLSSLVPLRVKFSPLLKISGTSWTSWGFTGTGESKSQQCMDKWSPCFAVHSLGIRVVSPPSTAIVVRSMMIFSCFVPHKQLSTEENTSLILISPKPLRASVSWQTILPKMR